MRIEYDGQTPHVYLSRRNLLALLTKLDMPGSARTIVWHDEFSVTSEPDDVHYSHESRLGCPPGVMHPQTEADITRVNDAGR